MTCPPPAVPWWPPIRALPALAVLCTAIAACGLYVQRESSARPMPELRVADARFGALTVTGAVEWRAERPDFGGFSGLLLEEDGGFIALTDKAHWARARLVLDEAGALTGIEGLEVGRLDGPEGRDLMHPYTDSEALTRSPDGAFIIGFEGRARISRFATLRGAEEQLPDLPDAQDLPLNGAFESVMALPDGRIIAVAETTPDWRAGYPGWIRDGEAVARFTLAKDGWFAPTDMALGPEGEWVYVLERRFTLIGGFAMRLSRFPLTALTADARIEPELLGEITGPPLTENYEGLATARDAAGRTVLYILSDDNFRVAQRTLLVQLRVED